jgi:hypothetical protein
MSSIAYRLRSKKRKIKYILDESWFDLIHFNYKKYTSHNLSLNDDDKYISVSKLKNHIMKTPDVDIIKRDKLLDNISSDEKYFPDTLLQCGINFEKYVYGELTKKFDCCEINFNYDDYKKANFDIEYIQKLNNDTKIEMENGTPIILQGVLINHNNKTYGISDIIIRSDYLKYISNNFNIDDEINIGCNISDKYHYRIIDIKYTTIELNTNMYSMKNSKKQYFYKNQICLYSSMLYDIQGYVPNYAYVIGTKYEYNSKGSHKEFSWNARLGTINFREENIMDDLLKSIVYKRDFMKNPQNYTFDNIYFRPNINIDSDPEYNLIRNIIAKEYKDSSLIYNISTKERQRLIDCGINTYDEIDIKELKNKYSKIFIKNKENIPKRINWYNENSCEYFFDYENLNRERILMLNNIYDPKHKSEKLFMIGLTFAKKINIDKLLDDIDVEYIYKDYGSYEYVGFYVSNLDDEILMMENMMEFILNRNKLLKSNNKFNKFNMFHWSQAEIRINDIVFDRMKDNKIIEEFEEDCVYVDLLEEFKKHNIFVKGMKKYGLKNVANAFYKNNYINTNWDNSKYSNGLIAMLECEKMYSSNFNQNIIDDILKYNQVDCNVMFEIVQFLRKKK